MATIIPVMVDGVPTFAQVEYSSAQVAQIYLQNLQAFVNVLNVMATTNANGTVIKTAASSISAGNLAAILQAIQNLQALAKNGVSGPDSVTLYQLNLKYPNGIPASVLATIPMTKSYMGVDMANDLNVLLRSIQGVPGFTSFNSLTLTQLQQWRDLAVQSHQINQVVQDAQNAALTAHRSLQSMVELEYVKTGNDILGTALQSLQTALSTTQNALNLLADLQNLHNQIRVPGKGKFPFIYGTNPGTYTAYKTLYLQQASSFFGSPITPTLLSGFTSTGLRTRSAQLQLVTLRLRLKAEISALTTQTPLSAQNNPDTLLGALKAVLGNISAIFVDNTGNQVTSATPVINAFQGLRKWLLDGYSSFASVAATQAGQIQQNITTAITAGENLNDTQKEKVQNYLFIFQEYYKSASAVLTSLTQILQTMAQNIAR